MHVFRRARIPLACLPLALRTCAAGQDPRIEPWRECDVTVEHERIVSVHAVGALDSTAKTPGDTRAITDLGGSLVLPGLLDAHTHLDKAHTWSRAPNPRGEFWDAIKILHEDSRHWTAEDLYRRAHFSLRCAYAHGTVAIRTHLDTSGEVGGTSHAVIQQLKAEWAGRIELQTISLCNLAAFASSPAEAHRILTLTHEHRATALGGFPQPNSDLAQQYDRLMSAARELGIGLDLHVDESGLVQAECLRAAAEAVLRNQIPYPVTCGHTCSLAVQDPARAATTIELVREAGIHVVALPLCNLYLQGRMRTPVTPSGDLGSPLTPRWRGITLLHELMEAGVPVACASDNVRDAFYAWGDLDALEVYHASVRIAHLDTRLLDSISVITTGPAKVMGLDTFGYGQIAPGSPARMIVLPAQTFNELLARPASHRRLVYGESFRERHIPSYSELTQAS
ncbi:MAG TPA: cytosine deaminase [Opitutaceae bacterium]|nr:cytosine deaminase [Opitutaceae bacterium]